jgi:hypothetical protein
MQHSWLLLLLLGAVLATLYVQANGDQGPLMQLVWWLTITLGLTLLGWTMGLVTVAP